LIKKCLSFHFSFLFVIFRDKLLTAMETKKRKPGIPLLIIGTIVFGQHLTRINYDAIRTVDYLVLGSSMVLLCLGFYSYYKSSRNTP
jgi:hypothetical protein